MPSLSSSSLTTAIRSLAAEPDDAAIFRRVVAAALHEIPGAAFGGISELTDSAVRTRAASHPHVEQLDRAQYASHEGPCLTAASTATPVVVSEDLGRDARWPRFGRAAARFGVCSAISFTLSAGAETIGALNVYAQRPGAFGADAQDAGSLLAAHAAVVMAARRRQANLTVALASRDAIGQAKGILMERYKFDDRQAFDALIAVSQHTHRKLRDVAEELRTTGELPGFG